MQRAIFLSSSIEERRKGEESILLHERCIRDPHLNPLPKGEAEELPCAADCD
jgi:hypothetical protein